MHGRLLQRDVDSAARAMLADSTIKSVNVASLNKWLRATASGEGKNKVTNETKHAVAGKDLKAIQERYGALQKESGSTPKPKIEIVEEKKTRGGLKEKREAVMFPHDGKHQPPSGLIGKLKKLAEETEGKNAVALYKTADPITVIAWEQKAIDEGFTLGDNFTIIYGFDEVIGADGGEMTRFMRMEGHHHGHPIREHDTSVSTAFDSYIDKEVANAKRNQPRLKEIHDFLLKVKVNPKKFAIKLEEPKKEEKKEEIVEDEVVEDEVVEEVGDEIKEKELV